MKTCLNCHQQNAESNHFCPSCGQKASVHRINTHFMIHEVIHAFTHADSGIFYLIKELAIRPGEVIKEYVAGARKKYYNPFNFFLITVAISAFLATYFHVFDGNPDSTNPISNIVTKYVNWIFIASVPIQAFFTWLFFRKKKYNYAENIVFHLFLGGFRIVFYVLIFVVFITLFRQYYNIILYTYFLIYIVFVTWAARRFYEEKIWLTFLKIFLSFALTQALISVVIGFVYYAFFKNTH
ncbi:DUF3667 domain-containing protein [Emticicia sp. BO119]|uniref:DUF3667 domain-containing protein n=1 Tax=Emticicia sp. BO119 TaxID=2757768 RepID=UPI0015F1091C|nr:DUF3667 domain-containing protein [Emticicia sp. BO119]MBA4851253.1 DUF3667 domain-containing protein [Emticicia sp. BO119]